MLIYTAMLICTHILWPHAPRTHTHTQRRQECNQTPNNGFEAAYTAHTAYAHAKCTRTHKKYILCDSRNLSNSENCFKQTSRTRSKQHAPHTHAHAKCSRTHTRAHKSINKYSNPAATVATCAIVKMVSSRLHAHVRSSIHRTHRVRTGKMFTHTHTRAHKSKNTYSNPAATVATCATVNFGFEAAYTAHTAYTHVKFSHTHKSIKIKKIHTLIQQRQ